MPAPFILYACAAALSASGILVGTNFFVVPPGHVGVRRMLGKVDPQPVPPGAHLKSPLAAVHFESTRTRSVELNRIEVLTNEGLSVAFHFNVLYHVTAGGAHFVCEDHSSSALVATTSKRHACNTRAIVELEKDPTSENCLCITETVRVEP